VSSTCSRSESTLSEWQATSASNVSSRVAKLTDSPALPILRKAGIRVLVHNSGSRS
jgi:hypothetical protein